MQLKLHWKEELQVTLLLVAGAGTGHRYKKVGSFLHCQNFWSHSVQVLEQISM
jgi:hypothetical protein